MALRIVQKFGGTSVADIARLEQAALTVKMEVQAGHHVAVVVSAMAGVTNQLVGFVKSMSAVIDQPEYDAVVASGEQVTSGLLAIALQQIGVPARSFQGWQIPIITDDCHANAQIKKIIPDVLEECWAKGIVPVISGFQGISVSGRITTLGRGGSDTSAVALAAALQAHRCDIYTDVDGIYTADPRVVPSARKLDVITYDEMVELAAQGAKVLQRRSVETAQDHQVRVRVLSSFSSIPGTEVVGDRDYEMSPISGVTHSFDWSRIQFKTQAPPFVVEKILQQICDDHDVDTDMFLHSDFGLGDAELVFVIPKGDVPKMVKALEKNEEYLGVKNLQVNSSVAKVSIVGLNIRDSQIGAGHKLLKTLGANGIPADLIACSDLKFSFVMADIHAETAVNLLHDEFDLRREQ